METARAKPAAPMAEVKNGSHPLPWLNLVVTEPFYLLHLFIFFSYFVVRSFAVQVLSPDLSLQLLRREIQAVLTFSVLTAVKFVREETWEAFIADVLFYSKGFLFAVVLAIDYHVAFCYSVAFVVIFVLAQQPPYDGVGESSHLTPLQLETLFAEGNSFRFWLVEFRVLCSSTCVRTSRVFPDLSIIAFYANILSLISDLLNTYPVDYCTHNYDNAEDYSNASAPSSSLLFQMQKTSPFPNFLNSSFMLVYTLYQRQSQM